MSDLSNGVFSFDAFGYAFYSMVSATVADGGQTASKDEYLIRILVWNEFSCVLQSVVDRYLSSIQPVIQTSDVSRTRLAPRIFSSRNASVRIREMRQDVCRGMQACCVTMNFLGKLSPICHR